MQFSNQNISSLLTAFESDRNEGITSESVHERQSIYGLNKLETKPLSAWEVFFRQFKSAFILFTARGNWDNNSSR